MVILDYLLILIVLLFGFLGWRKGLLVSLGSIVGLILAAIIASRFYPLVSGWFGGTNVSNVLAFIIIFGLTVKIVSLLFGLIGKVFQIVTVLPFISSVDSLFGLLLGLIQGVFVLAITVYFVGKYPFNDWLSGQLPQSFIAKTLMYIAGLFIPLFPEALKKIKSMM